jgi:hypothetical protein
MVAICGLERAGREMVRGKGEGGGRGKGEGEGRGRGGGERGRGENMEGEFFTICENKLRSVFDLVCGRICTN